MTVRRDASSIIMATKHCVAGVRHPRLLLGSQALQTRRAGRSVAMRSGDGVAGRGRSREGSHFLRTVSAKTCAEQARTGDRFQRRLTRGVRRRNGP